MLLSPMTFGIIVSPTPHGNSQINPKTTNESKNSKVCTIKLLLDSSASASIVCKDVIYKRHRILKDEENKCSTIAGTFNTTFVIKLNLKLPESNAKCHFTDMLLNHKLILSSNKCMN